MKNYYDELEVSKTASKEVIEKVYKVLAKKYHPDTTKEADKQFAEEKFKIISEAYEVLSDDEKRKKYDIEFEQRNPTISYEDYMKVVNQRDTLNNTLRGLQNEFNQFRNSYNAQRTTQTQYQQNPYNQAQYRQAQFNQQRYGGPNQNFNNGFNNYQTQNPNYSNPNNGRKKKKYYYNAATGQPVSTFDYYKYKIRKFLSNLWFYIILGFILITLIKNILSSEFNQFFI